MTRSIRMPAAGWAARRRSGAWTRSRRELPEAAALRRWGGMVVTVPYLDGRSTTRIAAAAARLS